MSEKYDAIIIGAGIGGLVTASYLTKYGYKVLILEKEHSVGGCCTSFNIQNFKFDACVHSIGSLSKGGYVNNILSDLNLLNSFKFYRSDPADIIVSDNFRFNFYADQSRLVEEIGSKFPNEKKGFQNLLNFIYKNNNQVLYLRLRNKTFLEFITEFICNQSLIGAIGITIFGNAGLPPSKINAFTATILLKEFILDGGYYPEGGIQEIPDLLAKYLKANGCKILLSSEVKHLMFENSRIVGVVLEDDRIFCSKIVVANSSISQIFNKMINKEDLKNKNFEIIHKMRPTLSAFSIYLGVNEKLKLDHTLNSNIWILPNFNVEEMYKKIKNELFFDSDVYILVYLNNFFHKVDNKTVCIFVNAPFLNLEYWKRNKEKISNILINKAEAFFPNLSNNIVLKNVATPQTIYDYTFNDQGATYGWDLTCDQFGSRRFLNFINSFENLFFVGHWLSKGFGVPSVMNLGKELAVSLRKKI